MKRTVIFRGDKKVELQGMVCFYPFKIKKDQDWRGGRGLQKMPKCTVEGFMQEGDGKRKERGSVFATGERGGPADRTQQCQKQPGYRQSYSGCARTRGEKKV